MNGGWAWVCGWLAAAIGIPCTLAYATTRWRTRRAAAAIREARQADDDAWLATIGAAWHATRERTP